MKLPFHLPISIREPQPMILEEFRNALFVTREVSKVRRVRQREFERFQRLIETDDSQRAVGFPGRAQDGEHIGRRAEADIPDHELTAVRRHAPGQPELPHIERLGFRHRADDGMKRLAMRQRVDAVRAIGEFDETVCGG